MLFKTLTIFRDSCFEVIVSHQYKVGTRGERVKTIYNEAVQNKFNKWENQLFIN